MTYVSIKNRGGLERAAEGNRIPSEWNFGNPQRVKEKRETSGGAKITVEIFGQRMTVNGTVKNGQRGKVEVVKG